MREQDFFTTNTAVLQTQEQAKRKKVKFNLNDDVAYIYPWSPTKYLLFGKYTEEQLKRKRLDESKDCLITPILKKLPEITEDESLPRIGKNKHTKVIHHSSEDFLHAFMSLNNLGYDNNKVLDEIVVNERETATHPELPRAAIFSPNQNKDLLTNNPKIKNTAVKLQSGNKIRKKLISQNSIDKLDCRRSLPYISTKTILSEAFFSCMKPCDKNNNNASRMPSINGKLCKIIPKKQIPRSQISHRYAITDIDLDNIQHLNEEELPMIDRPSSRQTRPLPSIADQLQKQKNLQNQFDLPKRKMLAPLNGNIKSTKGEIKNCVDTSPMCISPRNAIKSPL